MNFVRTGFPILESLFDDIVRSGYDTSFEFGRRAADIFRCECMHGGLKVAEIARVESYPLTVVILIVLIL